MSLKALLLVVVAIACVSKAIPRRRLPGLSFLSHRRYVPVSMPPRPYRGLPSVGGMSSGMFSVQPRMGHGYGFGQSRYSRRGHRYADYGRPTRRYSRHYRYSDDDDNGRDYSDYDRYDNNNGYRRRYDDDDGYRGRYSSGSYSGGYGRRYRGHYPSRRSSIGGGLFSPFRYGSRYSYGGFGGRRGYGGYGGRHGYGGSYYRNYDDDDNDD